MHVIPVTIVITISAMMMQRPHRRAACRATMPVAMTTTPRKMPSPISSEFMRSVKLEAACTATDRQMSITLSFKEYFQGTVYAYQYFESQRCRTTLYDVKSVQFTVPLDGCGTKHEEDEYHMDGSVAYSNVIIVMPFTDSGDLLTSKAKPFRIVCREARRNTLRTVAYAPPAASADGKPYVQMKVVSGTDTTVAQAQRLQVGETAMLAFYYQTTAFWDVAISNCVAHDGEGPKSPGRVPLVDDNG
ncbi:PREDICTED: uncharacterized protein LOC106820713 [Priapulus caudatus]|uniref:Uncharacterized protein LOC106820713 n=1 Tax=Priapulus caudatus TaxID=37621 RepID=A0ABM1F8D6_PRICU|nr:PREDICTED: uncharacterized protein LOC106820713 [Priapulus caudatus]